MTILYDIADMIKLVHSEIITSQVGDRAGVLGTTSIEVK
ncbi:Uncharacterised protein [Yersinia enterocolitica]|nr:Uncharacterised protein [Yersinia enterocolitica]